MYTTVTRKAHFPPRAFCTRTVLKNIHVVVVVVVRYSRFVIVEREYVRFSDSFRRRHVRARTLFTADRRKPSNSVDTSATTVSIFSSNSIQNTLTIWNRTAAHVVQHECKTRVGFQLFRDFTLECQVFVISLTYFGTRQKKWLLFVSVQT